MKIVKAIAVAFTSLVLIGIIILFEIRNWPVGSSLAGIGLGFVLPYRSEEHTSELQSRI